MNRALAPIAFVVAGILFVAANSVFIVPQTQQALLLRLGQIQSVVNRTGTEQAGLWLKVPFVENVIMFDKRNLGFNMAEQEIVAADQERLRVDAHARWRIQDPLRFYQNLISAEAGQNRLENIITSALRSVLGSANSQDIVSSRRNELMRAIAAEANKQAAPLGITVVDVRIRQADLPDATAERVYERMRTERQQVAANLRAKGDEEAAKVRAEADRTVTVTIATAREEAEKIRGAGDAERAKIFASSFGRDAEFARFYRSMQAYERAIPKGTQMVIPPEGEFFRYMRDQEGGGRR